MKKNEINRFVIDTGNERVEFPQIDSVSLWQKYPKMDLTEIGHYP